METDLMRKKSYMLHTKQHCKSYMGLKFITWNMDGMEDKNLKIRTKAICQSILEENADVVFLQEVVPDSAKYFSKHLTNYECLFSGEKICFSATFLKKTTVKIESHQVIDFPTTRMMRNIHKINVQLGYVPLCLMNVHLESTEYESNNYNSEDILHSEERLSQLKKGFDGIKGVSNKRTVIFAGDMNLTDGELSEIGGLPEGVKDVWIMLGRRQSCLYTWDMLRNDNINFKEEVKPRCRFDRVYFRQSKPIRLLPKAFSLIGLERLIRTYRHQCFPSSHWGIRCCFSLK